MGGRFAGESFPYRYTAPVKSTLLFLTFLLSIRLLPAADLTPPQQLGRDLLEQLVNTDTTHSTGDTTKAADLLAKRFVRAGFPEKDIRMTGPGVTNQNLVIRYRGTGQRPPILFMAHLDVVEAKREDWSVDPFKFLERDGFFYGRGTSDDKDGVASLTVAFLRLREEKFQPDRDLILAFTAGEEAAADYNGSPSRAGLQDGAGVTRAPRFEDLILAANGTLD